MPRRTPSATLPSDRAPAHRTTKRDGEGSSRLDTDMSSARVPHLSAEQQALKDERDRKARANLAAMLCDLWGVDVANPDADVIALAWAASEFRDLCDALGLGGAR